jgi:predicted transcriptional regulator
MKERAMNTEPEDDEAYKEWFLQQVQVGIDDIEAGRFISNEEMKAESTAWDAKIQRKIAELAEQNKAA